MEKIDQESDVEHCKGSGNVDYILSLKNIKKNSIPCSIDKISIIVSLF
jgi:hypothetical protein